MTQHNEDTSPEGRPIVLTDDDGNIAMQLRLGLEEALRLGMSDLVGGLPTHQAILAALSTTALPKGSHLWFDDEEQRGVDVIAIRSSISDVGRTEALTERGAWVLIGKTFGDRSTSIRLGK